MDDDRCKWAVGNMQGEAHRLEAVVRRDFQEILPGSDSRQVELSRGI
ncbi:MAG: hypothetical protein JWQ42_3553 [Edaphobacter sp.]|nr:hypothetical protein [Edaphobacter sp.]